MEAWERKGKRERKEKGGEMKERGRSYK